MQVHQFLIGRRHGLSIIHIDFLQYGCSCGALDVIPPQTPCYPIPFQRSLIRHLSIAAASFCIASWLRRCNTCSEVSVSLHPFVYLFVYYRLSTYLCLSTCLSTIICLLTCLLNCLLIYLLNCLHPFVYLFVYTHLSTYLSTIICLLIRQPTKCLFVCLLVCLLICLIVCLLSFVYLFANPQCVCLLVYLFVYYRLSTYLPTHNVSAYLFTIVCLFICQPTVCLLTCQPMVRLTTT